MPSSEKKDLESTNINCTVCGSGNTRFYIETNAMMHADNRESYRFYSCVDCNSKFLSNPVKESDLSKYYTESYLPYRGSSAWGKFSKFVEWDDDTLNRKRRKVLEPYLPQSDKIYILDVGCGKPDFLAEVAKDLRFKCTGVDFTEADWKNEKYNSIHLQACDWKNAEFDHKFHLITAWHYLEHDYNIKETIARLNDIILPGGFVIIEVPMFEGLLLKLQKQFWQGWHSPRHLNLFSSKSWSMIFDPNNWTLIKRHKFGTLSAFTLWWLGYRQKRKTNWSGNMENYFWSLVMFKILLAPLFLFEKFIPFGIQTVIIQKNK